MMKNLQTAKNYRQYLENLRDELEFDNYYVNEFYITQIDMRLAAVEDIIYTRECEIENLEAVEAYTEEISGKHPHLSSDEVHTLAVHWANDVPFTLQEQEQFVTKVGTDKVIRYDRYKQNGLILTDYSNPHISYYYNHEKPAPTSYVPDHRDDLIKQRNEGLAQLSKGIISYAEYKVINQKFLQMA